MVGQDGDLVRERNPTADNIRAFDRHARRRLAYGLKKTDHSGQYTFECNNADELLKAKEKAGNLVIIRDVSDPKTGKLGWRIVEA